MKSSLRPIPLGHSGLGAERYDKIRSEVTTVIANAWSVNFTLNVESFEKGNIAAAFNLINLAITSGSGRPADFFFSSS
jgi:thioester reductase-like protein